MHAGEVATDEALVHRLLAEQLPQWADLPLRPVAEQGTDHALYRLGDDLVVRLPRIDWAVEQAARDARWLPVLAPSLPVPVPVPLAVGEPGAGYPWPWSVVPWLAGENPAAGNHDGPAVAAELGAFVAALHRADPSDGPVVRGTSRGVPLAARDEATRAAVEDLGHRVDRTAVLAAWDQALSATPWQRPGVWIHGDLDPGNLLVAGGHLSAVIDFGGLGVGDPAPDLGPAWSVLDRESRPVFREAVGCDEDTWQRGRGWALSTALIGLGYYWETFPAFVATAQRKIAEVLGEGG
jgi:aminoglycoside phosphotransferase (APT) family kinase protein